MTSFSIPRETAAIRTAAHEPLTGRIPTAWATSRDDESQSATFRALAWSQEDDSVAEPLPYIGEDYAASEAESLETVRNGEGAAGSRFGIRFSRPALLYGIAAGFAAFAVGGLLLTVVNADITPTTTSATVIQPVMSALSPQPNRPAAPARTAAAPPARAVPPVANAPLPSNRPRPVVDPPVSTGTAITPDAPTVPTPEVPLPLGSEPQVATPPVATPPVATPLVATPPVATPPVATPEVTPAPPAPPAPPIVSVPEVTPQPVPHPVGPIVIRVPKVSDPAIPAPAATAASNPGISLKPGVTIPVVIPTLSPGAGQ